MSSLDTNRRARFPPFKCLRTQKVPNPSSHVIDVCCRGFLPTPDEIDLKIQISFSQEGGFSTNMSRMYSITSVSLCHTRPSVCIQFESKMQNTHNAVVLFRKPYIDPMSAISLHICKINLGLKYTIYSLGCIFRAIVEIRQVMLSLEGTSEDQSPHWLLCPIGWIWQASRASCRTRNVYSLRFAWNVSLWDFSRVNYGWKSNLVSRLKAVSGLDDVCMPTGWLRTCKKNKRLELYSWCHCCFH